MDDEADARAREINDDADNLPLHSMKQPLYDEKGPQHHDESPRTEYKGERFAYKRRLCLLTFP